MTQSKRQKAKRAIEAKKLSKRDKELKEGLEKEIKKRGFDTSRVSVSVFRGL